MTDASIDIETRVAGAAAAAPAGEVRDFLALLKPRVMSLVVFTGFAGLYLAPGEIHPVLAVIAVLCIAVAAGAAGAINMWYDRDIDALMARTVNRPIPSGKVDPDDAVAFGTVLSIFSVMIMGLAVNWVAAALTALTIVFYVFVYTMWLKRRTPQNIVIGGAAGALPPVIGWAAVTGDVTLEPVVLFAIIFMWTPPHFWALSLYREGDYAAAGVPMLPNVAGRETTKRQMLAYTVLLFPIGLLPWVLGTCGPVYLAVAVVAGLLFLLSALQVLKADTEVNCKRMFGYSILYLFAMFGAMLIDPAARLAAGG